MRSATPKVLHSIGGRSLLGHAVAVGAGLSPQTLVVVVGHGHEQVSAHLAEIAPDARVAMQDDQRGTGHAVQCALDQVQVGDGTVVVTYGDVPLLSMETLAALVATHEQYHATVTVLTADVADPTGYGRIVRDEAGRVCCIVEQRDADDAQRAITEINSGIYAFDGAALRRHLDGLGTDNDQGELYLTDVVRLARQDDETVATLLTRDSWQTAGVNDRVQLATIGAELNRRVVTAWMRAGVTVIDPSSTWIETSVTLERDVTLLPGVHLTGTTSVAEGAVVGPDTSLHDTVVESGATVVRSHATQARIGVGATVGPFTHLRPGADLGDHTKAGAYVEIKASRVGPGSKVPHLSYVGDATIGESSNIGAATVFVNYDGAAKHRTTVGDHVRIGSDTMLVAPVTIGDGAYTAAGSVITDDVPPGAMGVGRARQRTIAGWVRRRRAGSPAARAAEAAEATSSDPEATSAHQPPSSSTDTDVGQTSDRGDGRR